MKIVDLLENKNNKFDAIFKTQYFKQYMAPILDTITDGDIDLLEEADNIMHYTTIKGKYNIEDAFILHGSSKNTYRTGDIITVTGRKFPTDSSYIMHNAVNEFSEEKFNVDIRSLLFGTFHIDTAMDYAQSLSNINIIIPDDDYIFYYSTDYDDFYIDFLRENAKVRNNVREFGYTFVDYIQEEKDSIKNIFSDNIKTLAKNNNVKPESIWNGLYASLEDAIHDYFKKLVLDPLVRDTMIDLNKYASGFIDMITDDMTEDIQSFDIKIPKDYDDSMKRVLFSIMKQFIQDFNEMIDNLANEYVSTVVSTTNPLDIHKLNEIMIDTNRVHTVSIIDILKMIKVYKGIK